MLGKFALLRAIANAIEPATVSITKTLMIARHAARVWLVDPVCGDISVLAGGTRVFSFVHATGVRVLFSGILFCGCGAGGGDVLGGDATGAAGS